MASRTLQLLKWLVSWNGAVTREQYAAAGASLTLIKFFIDRLVADQYGKTWNLWNYFLPTSGSSRDVSHALPMYAVLWAVALPFFWVGVALTLRRLRSVGAHPSWLFLFFVPVANLIFFLVLCVIPPRTNQVSPSTYDLGPASAVAAVLIAVATSLLLILLSLKGLLFYGGGLFLGVPFFVGFVSSAIYNYRQPQLRGKTILVATSSIFVLGLVILSLAYEGLICLLMAMPLAIPLAIVGGLVASSIMSCRPPRPAPTTVAAWLFLLPVAMLVEFEAHIQPPLVHVTTSVEIDAPVESVWKNVIEFPPLPEPRELLFRSGIAYPTSGQIYGKGVGAVRHCRFSTGEFIEPITVWDEDRLLAFDVSSQPMSMRELSPWKITPPHLERNYMLSRHGQFLLTALPGGRTRLEGTTWYQNYFWPQPYWRLWSDFIVHRIHRRVLEHVKFQAEHPRA